jgi:hypothetical protein
MLAAYLSIDLEAKSNKHITPHRFLEPQLEDMRRYDCAGRIL